MDCVGEERSRRCLADNAEHRYFLHLTKGNEKALDKTGKISNMKLKPNYRIEDTRMG